MRKHNQHSMDTEVYLELDATVEGYCTPGAPAVTNRAPEHCDPGYPGEVDNLKVYITLRGKEIDITSLLGRCALDELKEDLLEDYEEWQETGGVDPDMYRD